MLSSISPLGERARGQHYPVTAAAYHAGSLLGGAALGALLGTLGGLLGVGARPALVVLGGAAGLAGVWEWRHLPLWSWHRQVDENWLTTYRGWIYGAGFGLQLGTGVLTIVTSASVYLVLVAEVLSGQPAQGAVIGAVFGLARAVPLLAGAHVYDPAGLRRLHRTAAAGAGWARVATMTCLFLVMAAALLAGLLPGVHT